MPTSYVVNNSKHVQPFKVPLKKHLFNQTKVTSKSSCVIYLMECSLCENPQYVGKSEYGLNLTMNTYRNNFWKRDGPTCDKHF